MATQASTQTTFNRIVVPIDGSTASEAALTYATSIPCKELVLLHVAVDHEVIVPDWILRDEEERREPSLAESMERLAARLRTPERKVVVDMRVGDVAEEIIDAGRNADLIVMMTHGRGAAGRMIFGSIADRVVRHGETPTLMVRVGELTRRPKAPERIVVALDGSERAEQAIIPAARLAACTGLPLRLLRSVGLHDVKAELRNRRKPGQSPLEMSPTLYDDTLNDVRNDAREYLERTAARLRAEDLEVTTELLEGTVPFTLLWAVEADDLLVMTTRGQGGYKRWALGSVAEKMIRESPCPVLLQRQPEDATEDRSS